MYTYIHVECVLVLELIFFVVNQCYFYIIDMNLSNAITEQKSITLSQSYWSILSSFNLLGDKARVRNLSVRAAYICHKYDKLSCATLSYKAI